MIYTAGDRERIKSVTTFQESMCRHPIYSLGQSWSDLSGRGRVDAVAFAARDQTMTGPLDPRRAIARRTPSALLPVD